MPPQETNIILTFDAPLEIGEVQLIASQGNIDSGLLKQRLMASIKELKKENQRVIRVVAKHADEYLQAMADYIDVNLVMDVLPSGIINDLHETVKQMVLAGFEKECCHFYSSWWREFLQECLWRYGLQELNAEDVDTMEKIESWTKALIIAVRILFPNERKLCDRVFFGLSSTADISFTEVCREMTIHLLSFVDSFVNGSHLPNLLCRIILKVDETLCDLLLEIKSLFSAQYRVSIEKKLHKDWKSMGKATRGVFVELENLICGDTELATVPRGGLPPIISLVMDCLRDVSKVSNNTLREGFKEMHSVSMQIERIIELLESNLEAKSKNYISPDLGYIFMMNNLTYIRHLADMYGLESFLGVHWFLKNIAKVRQNVELYRRSSWNKVTDFLKLDSNNVEAQSIKEKLLFFNHHFEEICNVQSKWIVIDKQLRILIIKSIEDVILPDYGNFIGRFHDIIGKKAYQYIKYGILDIEDQINNLFILSKPMNSMPEIPKLEWI